MNDNENVVQGNFGKFYSIEQDLYDELNAVLDSYAWKLSLVSALDVMEILKAEKLKQ